MKKSLPIGIDNFENLIREGCYYVDKTSMLEGDYQDREEVLNEMLFQTVSFQDDQEALYHGIAFTIKQAKVLLKI
ncbi:MAG: AAA family ATPase [Eubacteriales bacterium]